MQRHVSKGVIVVLCIAGISFVRGESRRDLDARANAGGWATEHYREALDLVMPAKLLGDFAAPSADLWRLMVRVSVEGQRHEDVLINLRRDPDRKVTAIYRRPVGGSVLHLLEEARPRVPDGSVADVAKEIKTSEVRLTDAECPDLEKSARSLERLKVPLVGYTPLVLHADRYEFSLEVNYSAHWEYKVLTFRIGEPQSSDVTRWINKLVESLDRCVMRRAEPDAAKGPPA